MPPFRTQTGKANLFHNGSQLKTVPPLFVRQDAHV
ncbi:MAG: hypothetical protein ACI9NN_001810, partial [Bacteroidia bacterium]